MRSTAQPKTPLGWLVLPLGAALLAILLAAPRGARAEDPKGDEPKPEEAKPEEPKPEEPSPEGAKKGDAKKAAGQSDALVRAIKADPKPYEDLALAARSYFDLEGEHWRGRTAFIAALEAQTTEKRYFLKDMAALRWLVYQGRSFRPAMTDRKWHRLMGITEAKPLGGTLHYIKSNDLSITYSIPRKYPKPKDLKSKYPRMNPLPLLLTMHDRKDYADKNPGKALMKRRYGDKKIWEALYKDWLVLAPMAPAGKFVTAQGQPRADVFQNPFSVFWKHYHVDFDRVILDGNENALTMAGSMPIFFAGVVLRGKWKLSDAQKPMVKNFASVPVYVVNNPELGKALEEAGHPNVTKGIANTSLLKWMAGQVRKAPRNFTWNAARPDQALPYWVNLDGANWNAPKRTLAVDVVDTEDEPNTINVRALGIETFTLFLNDDVVDLDRKVRVVVNGHVEHDAVVEVQDKRIEALGRDFDFLFNRDPLQIRNSMYFGWLTPSRIVRIPVRKADIKKPVKDVVTKDAGPAATPEEEAVAERLMTKARNYIKEGLTEKALKLIKRVCGMPRNKFTQQAHKLAGELGGG
jgi:hypothetical protein